MIQIYEMDGTTLVGSARPISGVIREELNGEYAWHGEFTESDSEKIVEGYVVEVSSAPRSLTDVVDKFRIAEVVATLSGVSVYAPHISTDLADYFIEEVTISNKNGSAALSAIFAGATEDTGWSISSDILTLANTSIVRQSVLAACLNKDSDDSFINRWGGEALRFGQYFLINASIGADHGYRIAYRRNLVGLEATTDMKELATRIMPTGLAADDSMIYLPGNAYMDSAAIANYPHPIVRHYHYSDVKVGEDYPSKLAVINELWRRVTALFAGGIDLPRVTVRVNFVDLSKTKEYEKYAGLESVQLGDTVYVQHEPLNVNVALRVISYEYDTERNQYISLVLGNKKRTLTGAMNSMSGVISTIREEIVSVMRTADGKNAMYIQDAAPTGGDYRVGDIWYDSNAGNKMHHWNGTAWIADLFDTDAFAAESITAAKIESGAVTTAKIATGAITAESGIIASLDASKIVVGPLASYSAGYDPTLIAVGGRNLALGTEIDPWTAYSVDTALYPSDVTLSNLVANGNFDDTTGWAGSASTISATGNVCSDTANGTQAYGYVYQKSASISNGSKYAITMNVRVTGANCSSIQIGGVGTAWGYTIYSPVQNQWYPVSVIMTADTASGFLCRAIHRYSSAAVASGKVMEVKYVTVARLALPLAGYQMVTADYHRWICGLTNSWINGTANTHGIYRTNSVEAVAAVTGSGKSLGMQQTSTYSTMKLTAGATYTISFLARGNVPVTVINLLQDTASQYIYPATAFTFTTTLQKYSVTFVADANTGASTGSGLAFRYVGDVVSGSTWFEIQEVKLEAGNKATDWCPDTMDMAFPDTTTIDGGNIKTGKIESHDGKTYFDLDNDEIVMDGGANGSIKMNPTDGIQFLDNADVFIGGVASVGGVLGLIAQKIAGTADPTVWGQIGTITGGGSGLELVHKTDGMFFIVAKLVDGGFALLDKNEIVRFSADANLTRLFDSAGVTRFYADATTTRLFDSAGVTRFYADATATRLYGEDEYQRLELKDAANYSTLLAKNGASYNAIGVDGTGAYKIVAGTKTYL